MKMGGFPRAKTLLRAAGRGVEAGAIAGLVITAVDFAAASGAVALGDVLVSGSLFVLPLSVVGAVLAVLGELDRLARASAPVAALLAVITAGALASPSLTVASALGAGPGTWVLVFCGLVLGGGSTFCFARSDPYTWAMSASISANLAHLAVTDIGLQRRIDPQGLDVYLAATLAANVAAVGLAWASARIARWARGEQVGWAWFAVGGVGTGIAWVAATALASQYPITRLVAAAGAGLLLAIGAAALPTRGKRVARAAPLLAVGVGCAVVGTSTFDVALFTVGSRWSIAREIVRELRLSDRYYRHVIALLEANPAVVDGPRITSEAAAWNNAPPAGRAPDGEPLSFVLVTVDTLRYDYVGYSGQAPAGITPSLDRLAERSLRYHRCYAQGGYTVLSLPALLWSRPPLHLRYRALYQDVDHALHLDRASTTRPIVMTSISPLDEPTPNIAELLNDAGYDTIAVGNDGYTALLQPHCGFNRGFRTRRLSADTGYHSDFGALDTPAAEMAIEELGRVGGRPFFLWMHLFAPHSPYPTPPPGSPFREYEGAVRHADDAIGMLLGALDDKGLTERTVVIVTSDHGEAFGEHGNGHHGHDLFDESVRVPLLVAIPGRHREDVGHPVGLIDVAPTMLTLAGVPVPASMEGYRLVSGTDGPPLSGRPPIPLQTMLSPGEKDGRVRIEQSGLVDGDTKVMLDQERRTAFCFDLGTDPGEKENLFLDRARSGDCERVGAMLLGWIAH